ncbi:MAG: DNA-protecting protein DprA [Nocardioides sp.]|nr:DNA-processing protein DprA [Nocardioidaceae bacterium]MCB8958057.1 DNA-protecting protein DprA [Nocardioides sp.]
MTGDAERLARVALSVAAEPGDDRLLALVDRLGPELVHDQLRTEGALAPRFHGLEPARVLADAERAGLRFVAPGDEEWPRSLDDLGAVAPLQRRGGVPVGLWVRGPLRLDVLAGSVAVVGSRSATTYGADVAAGIASDVARAGRPVLSGGAFGIDQAAHRGALSGDGGTVAVLACGADRVYPEAHRRLIEHLAAEGAVVSETAPGGAPMRIRFLARNRLIAALATGTVVVEAAVRSGALNTANWAGRLNRHVMGVPGPVTSASSQGVHQLVRTGSATLVTSGPDVLEVVASAGEHLQAEPRGAERRRDRLSHVQLQVLDAVPVAAGAGAESIARAAGLAVSSVRATLGELGGLELVEPHGAGWRLAAPARE